MLADKYLRDELNKFAKYVIQQSRSNLTKGKKNASKELYNSLGYEVSKSAKTTSLAFNMADYGTFPSHDRAIPFLTIHLSKAFLGGILVVYE